MKFTKFKIDRILGSKQYYWVLCLFAFSFVVIFLVIWFSIYSVLWIQLSWPLSHSFFLTLLGIRSPLPWITVDLSVTFLVQNKPHVFEHFLITYISFKSKVLVRRNQCLLAQTYLTLTRSPITFSIRFCSSLHTRLTLKTSVYFSSSTIFT